jgi:hypothetical protein
LASDVAAALLEGIKDAREEFGVDTDAGVADFEG